jgi:hypothetical protein
MGWVMGVVDMAGSFLPIRLCIRVSLYQYGIAGVGKSSD